MQLKVITLVLKSVLTSVKVVLLILFFQQLTYLNHLMIRFKVLFLIRTFSLFFLSSASVTALKSSLFLLWLIWKSLARSVLVLWSSLLIFLSSLSTCSTPCQVITPSVVTLYVQWYLHYHRLPMYLILILLWIHWFWLEDWLSPLLFASPSLSTVTLFVKLLWRLSIWRILVRTFHFLLISSLLEIGSCNCRYGSYLYDCRHFL